MNDVVVWGTLIMILIFMNAWPMLLDEFSFLQEGSNIEKLPQEKLTEVKD